MVTMKTLILTVTLSTAPVTSLATVTKCCPNIVINVKDPESEIHSQQGARLGFYSQMGYYGSRPQYK